MNKNFLKNIFHSDVGYVYEYIGSVPDDIETESTELCAHVTEEFINGHGDNLIATSVVQLPFNNNKILLYCNSDTDINTSDKFTLITDLIPDIVSEPTQETPAEEEQTQQSSDNSSESTGQGQ